MSTVAEPTYRKRVGYQSSLLGGFSTLAAALLMLGYNSTYEPIAQRQADDRSCPTRCTITTCSTTRLLSTTGAGNH